MNKYAGGTGESLMRWTSGFTETRRAAGSKLSPAYTGKISIVLVGRGFESAQQGDETPLCVCVKVCV